MDEAIREELAAFVERRKREGGAPTDFRIGEGTTDFEFTDEPRA